MNFIAGPNPFPCPPFPKRAGAWRHLQIPFPSPGGRGWGIGVVLAVLLISSCATTSGTSGAPAAAVSSADLQAKYPPGQYLAAVATSAISVDDARAKARSAVAAQIRSQIRSSAQTMIEKVAVQGAASVSGRQIQNIIENAEFSHAEQIRIDEAFTGRAGAEWRAVAFIHGPSVIPVLVQEYEQAAAQFRAASQAAMSDPSLAGFAAAYRACKAYMGVMSAKVAEMQALARAPYPAFDNDSGWWRAVLGRRAELVSRFQVCLQFHTELDAGHVAVFSSYVTGALSQMGIASMAGVEGCGGGTILRVDCQINCKQGHLGPMCQLDMNGTLVNAATGERLAEVPFGDMFKGAHGNDPEKAKKKACDAVTQDKVRAALERSFATVLPVE